MTDLIDCCLFRLGGLSADDPAAVDPGCFLFTFFDFLIEGRPFLRRQVVDRQEAQIGQSVCFLHIAVVSESRRFDVVQHLFRIAGSHRFQALLVLFRETQRQVERRRLVDGAAHEGDARQVFVRDFVLTAPHG